MTAAPGAMQGAAAGTPASSPSLFGSGGGLFLNQASSAGGSLFGVPAATTSSLFGATAQPSPGGGLFGEAKASSSSLFGAQLASSAAGGGLFGSAAGSGGGLFGAASSGGGLFGAASSGGLFGSSGATPGRGLFGTSSPASEGGFFASSGGGLFGATAVQPAGQLVAGGVLVSAPALSPALEPVRLQQIAQEQATLFSSLKEYDAAFTPGKGKLTRLFLYVLDPSKHARPANIPEAQWQFALRKARAADSSATGLWPVAIQGMGQLKIHRDEQQKGAEANRKYLSELDATVQRVAGAEEHEMRRRAQCLLRTHAELAHRLLKVVRLVDALEGRVVTSTSPALLYAKLQGLSEKLQLLEAQLAPNNVKGLKHAINGLCAAVELQGSVASGASVTAAGVDERTLVNAAELVGEHNKGIVSLQKHLRKVERDVSLVVESAKGPEMLLVSSQR